MAAPRRPLAQERQTVVTLARLAGVAASTVSRALKGDPRISVATRQRIEALAAARGYTPNAVARTLSSGRSGLVGVALGPMENPFYAEMMRHLVTRASARDIRLLVIHAGAGPIEDHTAQAVLQYQVDGCLITSAELSSRAARVCAAHDVPVVMVNRVPRLHASAVACANQEGARELAEFLLAGGHRRFAVVRGNPDSSTSLERERGFVERCRRAGGDIDISFHDGASYLGGFAAGRALAELPPGRRPDAVFGVNDIIAMGVMDAFRLAGVRVPRDVSVVGFDDIGPASGPIYRLTTVAQPLESMVARAFDLLAARIGDSTLPDEVVLLRGELIARDSARRPGTGRGEEG